MPLDKEFSMVADSTVSLSPEPSTDASAHIKRAVRTYGRRREESLEEPLTATVYAKRDSTHLDSFLNTAPPGLKDTVPPSPAEDVCIAQDNSDDDASLNALRPITSGKRFGWRQKMKQVDEVFNSEEDPSANVAEAKTIDEQGTSRDNFGWRQRLKLVDEVFDSEEDATSANGPNVVGAKTSDGRFGDAILLQEKTDDVMDSETTKDIQVSTSSTSISDDVFTCAPMSPSNHISTKTSFVLSSPSPPVAIRVARRRVQRAVQLSDSEEERPRESSSTAPSTSGRPPFSSPMPRSPSTQPTSDDEELPSKVIFKPNMANSRKPNSANTSRERAPSLALSSKDGKKGKKFKIKAPTKRELRETAKERGRLAAEMTATIPKIEQPAKYTMEKLLAKISGQPSNTQSSDPIEPFSSPSSNLLSPGKKQRQHAESPSSEEPAKAPNVPDPTDSEDELPEVAELIKRDATKELKELKQRALEIKYKGPTIGDDGDDDDDLVIGVDPKVAVKEEEEHRRLGRQSRPSTARRIVELFAHVNPTIKAKKSLVFSPNRVRKDFSAIIQDPLLASSGIDINRMMLRKAQDQASREIKRKEEEWTKHGGHLAQKILAPVEGFECAMKAIAGKGLETVKAKQYNGMDVDEDYGEDTDKDDEWTPEQRVSASPRSVDHDGRVGDTPVDEDITMVADDDDMDVEDADITKVHRKLFVFSDSEEEENDENAPVKPVNTKDRRSSTLSDMSTEDEHNKENDRKLLYEESEDKENMNIVRHSPLSKKFTIFDLTEQGGSSSFEAPSRSQGKIELNGDGAGQRRPFQLLSEESPKLQQFSPSNLTQSFASKLQHASPLSSTLAPAPTLKPFLTDGGLKTLGGFSQFSQAEPDVFAAPLQPGFSELFETGTEQRKSQITLKNKNEITADQSLFGKINNARNLKRTDTLDLTQDVEAAIHLQSAFQAEGTLKRQADGIFEKEQAFVMEANTKKLVRQNTELYVNELGFLTQTRPLDGTPEVYYRPSPSRSALSTMRSPSESRIQIQTPSQRVPLRTISLSSTSQFESPEQRPLRRLRKAPDSPRNRSPTASPPMQQPRQFNLFHRAHELERKKAEKLKRRATLGALFEDEAAESDDDDLFGFVTKKSADDEEGGGEDLDRNLPELMDDGAMDADTEAAELVLDKYKEHLDEDDKKLEELHQAAVQGELRKKRNRGVGVDDSDEDSDVENNERAMRAMKKARKSDRTDIKGLEANEETRPFADTYNQSLRDDEDEDFAYLGKESQIEEVLGESGADEAEEDDNEGEEAIETVDTQEIYEAVLQQAQEGRLSEVKKVDPHDISWMEQDEDVEVIPRVKNVNTRQRPQPRPQDVDALGLDGTMGPAFRQSTTLVGDASIQWCALERKLRTGATARSVGGSAITGHAKAKSKTGTGTAARKGQTSSSSTTKPIRATASALSVISRSFG